MSKKGMSRIISFLLAAVMLLGFGATGLASYAAENTRAVMVPLTETAAGAAEAAATEAAGVHNGNPAINPTALNAVDVSDRRVEDGISQEQLDAWRQVNRESRVSGLVGFEGEYSLDGMSGNVSVIVEFVNQPAAVALTDAKISGIKTFGLGVYDVLAKADQAAFRSDLDGMLGGAQTRAYKPLYEITAEYNDAINGVAVTIPADRVAELAEMDCVYAVYPDKIITLDPGESGSVDVDSDALGMADERAFLDIDALHAAGIKGKGVTVGVIDTGVDYNHPDLKDAFGTSIKESSDLEPVNGVYYGRNFVEYDGLTRAGNDPMETTYDEWKSTTYSEYSSTGSEFYTSHGTHVSGTVAGRGVNEPISALGMAPEATLLVYRALGPYGSGYDSWILGAIDSVYKDGCDVVNMSLGGGSDPFDAESVAVNNMIMAYDIVFAISSGNGGPNLRTLGSPGTATLPITVGNGTVDARVINLTATALAGSDGEAGGRLRLLTNDLTTTFEQNEQDGSYNIVSGGLNPAEDGVSYKLVPLYSAPGVLGTGTEAEFKAAAGSIAGNIAVVARGQAFVYTAEYAKKYGAGAVIVITNNTGAMYPFQDAADKYVPLLLSFTKEEGMELLEAALTDGGLIRFTDYEEKEPEGGNTLSESSSRGPVYYTYDIKPDIVAPGASVMSAAPYYITSRYAEPDDPGRYVNAYQRMSGTSMASPHIAGIVALMRQYSADTYGKTWSASEIKARVMNTANPLDGDYSVYEVGAGYVNPVAAINAPFYATVAHNAPVGEIDMASYRYSYEMKDADVASLSFGFAYAALAEDIEEGLVLNPVERTRTVTIHNPSDSQLTLTPSAVFNTKGQSVRAPDAAGVKLYGGSAGKDLTVPGDPITVPARGTAEFDVTIYVPAETTDEYAGSYEGYVIFADTDSGAEISLPFALRLGTSSNDPAFVNLYLNKPVIAPEGAENRHLELSSSSDLYFRLQRDVSYIMPLIVDPDDPEKVLGWLGYYWDLEGLWDWSEYVFNYDYYITNLVEAGEYYPVDPEDEDAFLDDPVPFEPGYHMLGLLTYLPEGKYQQFTLGFYADDETPEVTVDGLGEDGRLGYGGDPERFALIGNVYDAGLAEMAGFGITFNFYTEPTLAEQSMNAVIAEFNGSYYRADVNWKGNFTLELPVDPFQSSESITLYALDSFTMRRIEGYDDFSMIKGFDPAAPSYQIYYGLIGHYGVNMIAKEITLAYSEPYMALDASSATMYVGDSRAFTPRFNALAGDDHIVRWESDDSSVAAVSNGVVKAVSPGVAAITATSANGLTYSCVVTVKETFNDGVSLPAGSYIYYGTYRHADELDSSAFHDQSISAGYDMVTYDELKSPILWQVAGYDGNATTLVSEYLLDTKPFYPVYTRGIGQYTKHWADSYIRSWLNDYDFEEVFGIVPDYDRKAGDPGSFLDSFTSVELAVIPTTRDITMINPAPYAEVSGITDDRVYLPDCYDWSESLVTWSAGHEEDTLVTSVRGDLKSGKQINTLSGMSDGIFYWLRSPYGGYEPNFAEDPGFVMYVGARTEDGYQIYRTVTPLEFGIRPVTSIDTDYVLYANKIAQGGGAGSVSPDDTNYILRDDGGAYYKLTVLGENGGRDVGELSVSSKRAGVSQGSDYELGYVSSSKYGGDYVIAYKIVGGGENAREILAYGEFDTSSAAQRFSLPTSGLGEGEYRAYLWLQKNNGISSNEAGVVAILDLSVTPRAAEGIILDNSSISLALDSGMLTYPLTATVMPESATNQNVLWSSGNESVATVDENGVVTAKGAGTAVITAASGENPDISASCAVTVYWTAGVKITELVLTPQTIPVGGKVIIPVIITPSEPEPTVKTLLWSSDNESVAIVDQSGTVTGVSSGLATITAKAVDGSGVMGQCAVTVSDRLVTGITLEPESAEMNVGDTLALSATVSPADAANPSLTWSSSDETVARVNINGTVTAVGAGSAVITAAAQDGSGVKAACEITVSRPYVPATGVALDNKGPVTLPIGGTIKLTATVLPADATDKSLVWSSTSMGGTVSVTPNDAAGTAEIKALTEGYAFVTVSLADGSASDTCLLTVVAATGRGPSVSMDPLYFDKAMNAETHKDLAITVDLGEGTLAATGVAQLRNNNTGQTLTPGTDYTFDGDAIIIKTDYLMTLALISPRPYIFIVVFDDINATMVGGIQVYVSESASGPNIFVDQYLYSPDAPEDITVEIYFGTGSAKATDIQSVSLVYDNDEEDYRDYNNNRYDLKRGTDYTLVGNIMTIKKEFIEDYLDEAVLPLRVHFNDDSRTAPGFGSGSLKLINIRIDGVPAEGVVVTPKEIELAVGEEYTLAAKVLPGRAYDRSVTWSSSDPSVAAVSNGHVTAIKSGEAVITATTVDGGFTDTCTVRVVNAAEKPTVLIPESAIYVNAAGQAADMYVLASVSDGGTLSYQWYNGVTGEAVPGGTNQFCTVISRGDNDCYYVVVTNTNESVNGRKSTSVQSGNIYVRVSDDTAATPGISSQPQNMAVNVGGEATLHVTASSTDGGTLSYQWYRCSEYYYAPSAKITGATNANVTVNTSAAGTYFYFVEVTNTNDNVPYNQTRTARSSLVIITVSEPGVNAVTPVITGQPRDRVIPMNGTGEISVEAAARDGGTLSYQWYKNSANLNFGGAAIEGATGAGYRPETTAEGTYYYYVVVTNTNSAVSGGKTASVASDVVTVTVVEPELTLLNVSVSTLTIVSTLSAYLNITVAGAPQGANLKAYLEVDGELLYETAVINGSGRMYISKAPEVAADTVYRLVVKDEGCEGECEIKVVFYNTDIWVATAFEGEGGYLSISFNAPISSKTNFAKSVTIGGKTYNATVENGNTLVVKDVAYGDLEAGTKIVISGVKYQELFPSYSFTFTISK